MTTRKITVLFTSAGRRVELVRAFHAAFERLGVQGRIVVTDIDPLAPTVQVADSAYMVPRLSSPEYIPALLRVCEREGVDLLFPLIDPDISVLAMHRGRFEEQGVACAVVPTRAAEIVADKWLTAAFFGEIGVPIARTWLPDAPLQDAPDYPVFLKPRRGSASSHTYKIHNARELEFFSAYAPDPVVQEYLPGAEITTDVVCGLRGELLAVVSRRRIEVRSGEVSKGVTTVRPDIIEHAATIARELPAIGPITVQCILRNDEPFFTEINARFGGGVPLAMAAGVDAPALVIADFLQIPFDHAPVGVYEPDLYMTRFDESFMVPARQRDVFASRNI